MDVVKATFVPVEPSLEIDIVESDYDVITLKEPAYHCSNEDCDCETILRSYCFCPMCGFPINWIDP